MSRPKLDEVEAYSESTGRHYRNWDAMVAAESNGYVVVGQIIDLAKPRGVAVVGPFSSKEEARKVQARKRIEWNREVRPLKVRTQVRVLWKDKETLLQEESAARTNDGQSFTTGRVVCPLCGVWVCSRCGWRRVGANRLNPEPHSCAKCGGKRGKMLPVKHTSYKALGHLEEYERLKSEGKL